MKAEPTDEKLMLAAAAGDLKAYEKLYRKYAPRLINFSLRFVRSRQLAEEMAQEILLKVYESRQSYKNQAKFSTWLFRVATNHCLNEVRKSEYKHSHSSVEQLAESGVEAAAPQINRPDREVYRRQITEDVDKAVRELPQNQRAALTLLIDEGFSYGEIAESLQVSVSAVKSLISRARENLKEKLNPLLGQMGNEYEL